MSLLWTTPTEWTTKKPITKEELNKINDNILYLAAPSVGRVTVRNGTTVTTTSTTPAVLDAAYDLSVELSGVRDVRMKLQGIAQIGTLAAIMRFDVLIDNTTYWSSLTGTQLTNGVWAATQYVASNAIPVSVNLTLPAGTLAAGVHTFKLRYWTSAGTLTWIEAATISEFEVGEF